MKWKTAISTHKDGELYARGMALSELIERRSFSEAIFLMLSGRMSAGPEKEIFDAMLVSMIEHGVTVPSAFVPRVSISVGNSMNAALAAGALATGDWHGGAIEKAAQMLQSEKSAKEIVAEALARKERLSGYGHKAYKDIDPRAEQLLAKAKSVGLSGGAFIEKVLAIREELKSVGKELPLNIDGAIAALMCELGLDWRLGKALFVLGRMPGMIAHAHEEMVREKPYRRLEDDEVEYDGPPLSD